ncbi:MAG: TonB-dependent receptor plug domain-containing protein [Rhodospirillaceae bacterium]
MKPHVYRRWFFSLLSSTSLAIATPAFAQSRDTIGLDEIVVTASRTLVPLKTVGSAIDILSADDVAQRPRFEVSDLLREIPGVAVNRSGQRGAQTQVRLRGSEGNHTLVLINGIEAGDPMTADEFDFANLLTDDIERIEVLRGPQSALYGSQAIGGVVNIVTREGHGPLEGSASLQGGSFGTYALNGYAGAGGEGYSMGASISWLDTRGISQAAGGTEKDGHQNFTINTSGHIAPSDVFDLSLAARYTQAYGEEDIQDFVNFGLSTYGSAIDSDNAHRTKTFYGRGAGRFSLLAGKWDHTFAVAITDVRKRNFAMKAFSFGAEGRRLNLSYQNNLFIGDADDPVRHTLTGYIQYKDENFENQSPFPGPQNQRRSTHDIGYVIEYRADIADQVFLSGAIRFDDHEMFRNATTYRATAAWQVSGSGLKLRASYGTGFAKPGFFELFGFDPTSFIGNPNLKPESSHGWDAGADYAMGDRALISMTYFVSDFEDEILNDFSVFPFTVRNVAGESTREGVELSARYMPAPNLTLAASYSYTESEDDRGLQEVRRPKHVASVSASTRFLDDRAQAGVSVDYNGPMTDVVFVPSIPSGVARLDDFTLVTVSGSYEVTEKIEVFARIENALDQEYQEVYTYGTVGIGAYAGVRLRFGG